MSMPPKFPVSKGNKHTTYFDILCEEAQKYLSDITLSFDGYQDTVDRYRKVKESDKNENYRLSVELNSWSEYFSEIANYIQNRYLDAETEKLQTQSIKSIEYNGTSVSAGDRHANTSPEVISSRKKRNVLKALYDALVAKQEFAEKAFYQCKTNYSKPDTQTNSNNA